MDELVSTLQKTPLPTILVVGGIIFLLLSISGGFAGKINILPNRQKMAGLIGGALLACGLTIYLIPISTQHTNLNDTHGGNDISEPVSDLHKRNENSQTKKFKKPPNELENDSNKWTLISDETFTVPNQNWRTGKTGDENVKCDISIVSGKYRWECNFLKERYTWSADSPFDPSKNFYAAVDVKTIPSQKNERLLGGISFRKTYNAGYIVCLLSSSRFIQLYYYDTLSKDKVKILVDWLYIPGIKINDSNRIAVQAIGSHIKIFINDKLSASIDDDSQLNGGIALFVANADDKESSGVIDFDNFIYRIKPESSD